MCRKKYNIIKLVKKDQIGKLKGQPDNNWSFLAGLNVLRILPSETLNF